MAVFAIIHFALGDTVDVTVSLPLCVSTVTNHTCSARTVSVDGPGVTFEKKRNKTKQKRIHSFLTHRITTKANT